MAVVGTLALKLAAVPEPLDGEIIAFDNGANPSYHCHDIFPVAPAIAKVKSSLFQYKKKNGIQCNVRLDPINIKKTCILNLNLIYTRVINL
mgnify:CR=1 FL=1